MENLSLHRDGIFGIFGTRLESFAPCYSQSFYWRIFKKTMLYFVFKKAYKKVRKTRKLESIRDSILWKGKMMVEN
jgi:hypothetical protein